MSSLLVVVQVFSSDPKVNKPLGSSEFFINKLEEKVVVGGHFDDFKEKAIEETEGADYAVVASIAVLPI